MKSVCFFISLLSVVLGHVSNEAIDKNRIKFEIVTRKNPTLLPLLDPKVLLSVENKPTVIVIHGWTHYTTGPTSFFPYITQEYLKKGDYNVILVHADSYMFYSEEVSATYTDAIGNYIGDVIVNLHHKSGLSLSNVHIIGHGLGSHIAGAAGRRVHEQLSEKVSRITALEVTKVGFENVSSEKRLDKTDAKIVDVIHAAAGLQGLNESVGTADFWPNGGVAHQPGCLDTLETYEYCSFDESISFFIYTINSLHEAVKCFSYEKFKKGHCTEENEVYFGDNYSGKRPGNYYLDIFCHDRVCHSSTKPTNKH